MTVDVHHNLKAVTIRHNGGVHTYTGSTLRGIVRDRFGPDARVGNRPNSVGETPVLVTRGRDQLVVASIVEVKS